MGRRRGDTKRQRLLVWGGGHGDYLGNEVYALDIGTRRVQRLTDPTLPLAMGCPEALAGSTPNSRHTYDGLSYLPAQDAMLSVGGALAPCGNASPATWSFAAGSGECTLLHPSGTEPMLSGGVIASNYDPNTGLAFVSNPGGGRQTSSAAADGGGPCCSGRT